MNKQMNKQIYSSALKKSTRGQQVRVKVQHNIGNNVTSQYVRSQSWEIKQMVSDLLKPNKGDRLPATDISYKKFQDILRGMQLVRGKTHNNMTVTEFTMLISCHNVTRKSSLVVLQPMNCYWFSCILIVQYKIISIHKKSMNWFSYILTVQYKIISMHKQSITVTGFPASSLINRKSSLNINNQ